MTLTTTSRPLLATGAILLCVVALAISVLDGDPVLVSFFATLSVVAAVVALLARGPWEGWRRGVGLFMATAWIVVGIAIAAFIGLFQSSGSYPVEMPPQVTYLGLTATVYHLMAVYGGGALIGVAAFTPGREPSPTSAG